MKGHICAAAVLISLGLLCACDDDGGRKKDMKAAPAVNPYSVDSVFGEVKKKLEVNPEDTDALFHMADLYERNSQYKEAVETFSRIVKIKPDSGYVYYRMGTAYDRMENPAEAVDAFKKAIKYMPSYAPAYNNMGVAYGRLGRFRDEAEALKKAVKLRPSYSSAHYNLGVTYLKIGDKKAAVKEYEALREFDDGAAESLMKQINAPSPVKKESK